MAGPQNQQAVRMQTMNQQQMMQQQNMSGNPAAMQGGPTGMQPGIQPQGNMQPGGMQPGAGPVQGNKPIGQQQREKIWTGVIEWLEKSKTDQAKITRQVPCTVTANIKDGEPEM